MDYLTEDEFNSLNTKDELKSTIEPKQNENEQKNSSSTYLTKDEFDSFKDMNPQMANEAHKNAWEYTPGYREMFGNQQEKYNPENSENQKALSQPSISTDRWFLGDVTSLLARGAKDLTEQVGYGIRAIEPEGGAGVFKETGQSLINFSKKTGSWDIMKPDVSEASGENLFSSGWKSGVRSAVPSLAPLVVGMGAVAAAPILGVGALGASALGLIGSTAATLGIFGMGTYGQKKQEYLEKGIDEHTAHIAALKQGFIEGGIEEVSNLLGLMFFGFGKFATQPLKQTAKELLETPVSTFVKELTTNTLLNELPTEELQSILETKIDEKLGLLPEGQWKKEAIKTIIPTLTQSVLFSVGAQGMTSLQRGQIKTDLNSDSPEKRMKAMGSIANGIKEDDLREAWVNSSYGKIQTGEPIDITADFSEMGNNEIGSYVDTERKLQNLKAIKNRTREETQTLYDLEMKKADLEKTKSIRKFKNDSLVQRGYSLEMKKERLQKTAKKNIKARENLQNINKELDAIKNYQHAYYGDGQTEKINSYLDTGREIQNLKETFNKTQEEKQKMYNLEAKKIALEDTKIVRDFLKDKLLRRVSILEKVEQKLQNTAKKDTETQKHLQRVHEELEALEKYKQSHDEEATGKEETKTEKEKIQSKRNQETIDQMNDWRKRKFDIPNVQTGYAEQQRLERNQSTINQISALEKRDIGVPYFTENKPGDYIPSNLKGTGYKERKQQEQRDRREQGLAANRQYEIDKNDPEKLKKEKFFHEWAVELGDKEEKKQQDKNVVEAGDVRLGKELTQQEISPFEQPGEQPEKLRMEADIQKEASTFEDFLYGAVADKTLKDIQASTKDMEQKFAEAKAALPQAEQTNVEALVDEYNRQQEREKSRTTDRTKPFQEDIQHQYEKRIRTKYRDLFKLQEPTQDSFDIEQSITNGTLSPEELQKKLKRNPQKATEVKQILSQQLGEILDTYKYEGYQDGKNLETYFDSLLKAADMDKPINRLAGVDKDYGKLSDQRIDKKYKEILSLPESNLKHEDYQPILDMTITPEELKNKIVHAGSGRDLVQNTKSAITDLLGELKETHKYEGHTEGQQIEDYIDSLLNVTNEATTERGTDRRKETIPLTGEQERRSSQDRRIDEINRKKVDEMTPEEMTIALKTDHLTGLKNKRAYQESKKLALQASLDIDSLKWVNDNHGHEAGDDLLKAMGDAFRDNENAYHVSGDEYILQGNSEEEILTGIRKAKQYLKEHPLRFVDEKNGIVSKLKGDFSYGTAETLKEADEELRKNKSEREISGDRAARGEEPPGFIQNVSRGENSKGKEVTQPVNPYTKNFFKPITKEEEKTPSDSTKFNVYKNFSEKRRLAIQKLDKDIKGVQIRLNFFKNRNNDSLPHRRRIEVQTKKLKKLQEKQKKLIDEGTRLSKENEERKKEKKGQSLTQEPFKPQEQKPHFSDMLEAAAKWKGATADLAKALAGDKKARLKLFHITTKSDLDSYLIKKFGISETEARDVSNTLTHKNIKPNFDYDKKDFENEPWQKIKKTSEIKTKSIENTKTVYVTPEMSIKTKGEIVSLSSLQTSHDKEGNINKKFPPELQPRDRSRKGYQLQINNIAKNLKQALVADAPDAAHGAPILSLEEGNVEIGHGRATAIKQAYEENGKAWKKYRKDLLNHAKELGIDKEEIENTPDAVYVRRRVSEVEDIKDYVQKANESDIAKLSPVEQAKIDSDNLTPEDLTLLNPSEDGDLNAASNKPFIKRFLSKMSQGEQTGYATSEGEINKTFLDRMQAAIFNKAYNSEDLLTLAAEEANPDSRNIINGLQLAAKDFAKAQGINAKITNETAVEPLLKGIKLLKRAQNEYPDIKSTKNKNKTENQLKNLLNQEEMFEEKIGAEAEQIALFIAKNIRSGKRIGEFFKAIGSNIKEALQDKNQGSMFNDKEEINKQNINKIALERMRTKYENTQQNLFKEESDKSSAGFNFQNSSPSGKPEEDQGRTSTNGLEEKQKIEPLPNILSEYDLHIYDNDDGSYDVGQKKKGHDKNSDKGTYANKSLLKKLGAKWNSQEKVWRFDHDPTEELNGELHIKYEGLSSSDERLRSIISSKQDMGEATSGVTAKKEYNKAGTISDITKWVNPDTIENIKKGLEYGIPAKVIDQQIEDIALINRAFKTDKKMFLLANEAGTGKTFVLGGAIQEMKRNGAKSILYVTMNTQLIKQIKKDLSAFDIKNVDFKTYAKIRKEEAKKYDIVIFDESQNIKNIKVKTGIQASSLINKSKFAVFASATPFENPVEAAYLNETNIFPQGHWKWALQHGADIKEVPGKSPGKVYKVLIWPEGEQEKKTIASRQWFIDRGVMVQRDMQLSKEQSKINIQKVSVPEKTAIFYDKVSQALDTKQEELPSRDRGQFAMQKVLLKKRMLENAKIDTGIELAQEAIKQNRFPIIFVETKAQRKIDVNNVIEKYQGWVANPYTPDGVRKKAPVAKSMYNMALGLKEAGIEKIDLPSTAQKIIQKIGKENVAVYTGEVSEGKATANLQAWRKGKRKVLVVTMAKGGTGLSLHDTKGDHPTTQININLPWKASGVAQVSGRSARYGVIGAPETYWVFADNIPFDKTLAAKVSKRMQDMGSTIKGEVDQFTKDLRDIKLSMVGKEANTANTELLSTSQQGNQLSTPEEIKTQISKTIHPEAQKNLKIDVYNSLTDTKTKYPIFSKDDNIVGAYDSNTGRISLFADKIKKDEVHSLIMHETIHQAYDKGGWKAVFDKDSDEIINQIQRNISNGKDEWVQAQEQARDAGTKAEDLQEETIAYFLQNRDNAKTGTFQKIKRAIAGFLYRTGIKTEITDDVIHNIADRMLKAKAGDKIPGGKIAGEMQTELKERVPATVRKEIKFAKQKQQKHNDNILQDEENTFTRAKNFIKGNIKFFGEKAINERKDLTQVEHIIGTTMFNAKRAGGAFERLYNNVLSRVPENKKLKQDGLRMENDYSLFQPGVDLKKKNPILYKRVNKYIVKNDIAALGYTVKQNEETELYEIYDSDGKQISEPMMSFDKAWRTAFEEEANSVKFTDKEKEVLINNRKMSLNLYHHYADAINDIIRQHEIAGIEPPKVTIVEKGKPIKISLKTAMLKMGNRIGYYFPRIRETGGWRVDATKKGIPAELQFFKTKFGARQYKLKMRNQGYKTEITQSGNLSEDLYQTLAPLLAQEKVIQKTFEKMSTGVDFENAIADLFVKQYAATLKSHGSRSRMIGRSDAKDFDVKRGYETDLVKAMATATEAAAGGWAKQTAAIDGLKVITGKDVHFDDYLLDNPESTYKEYLQYTKERGIDASRQPIIYSEATGALKDILKNNEFADNVIASLKSAAVIKYLGGRVSSAAVNTTNMVMAVPAVIAGELKVPLHKAFGAITIAGKEYYKFKTDRASKLSPLFQEIEKRGLDTPQLNKEAIEALQSRTGGAYRKTIDISMYMFGETERINRATTVAANYLAIVEKARKPLFENNKVNNKWLIQAEQLSNLAHGDYSKANRLHISRGNNIGAQTLQAYSVFMTFTQTYLQEMTRLGLVKGQWGAAAYMALSGALLGGVGATIPMAIAKAISKIFDTDDPEEMVIKAMGGSDFVRYGLPSVLGLSIKGSLATRFELPKSALDIFGAPGSVVKDEVRGLYNLYQGNYREGIEKMFPTSLGSVSKAFRERNQGVTTRSGSPVYFGNKQIKGNNLDTVLRFLSFNPTNIDKKKTILYYDYKTKKRYNNYKRELNKRYKVFYLTRPENRDKNDIINLYADIRDFNKEIKNKKITRVVSPITRNSLHAALRRALRPSKQERLR